METPKHPEEYIKSIFNRIKEMYETTKNSWNEDIAKVVARDFYKENSQGSDEDLRKMYIEYFREFTK